MDFSKTEKEFKKSESLNTLNKETKMRIAEEKKVKVETEVVVVLLEVSDQMLNNVSTKSLFQYYNKFGSDTNYSIAYSPCLKVETFHLNSDCNGWPPKSRLLFFFFYFSFFFSTKRAALFLM